MVIKTEKLTQTETIECKICGLSATHVSYDVQGSKLGPRVYHCGAQDCRTNARNSARWFIGTPSQFKPRSIEEFLA